LLQGLSAEQIKEKAVAQYPPQQAEELIAQLPALSESLRTTTLFKTLLAD
jgi:hypothetical protein